MTIEPGKGIRTPGVDGGDEVVIHDARPLAPDEDFDRSLRPPTLEDFVNQVQVTEQLGVFIEAARRRGEALDHVLLAGPPGLGKTSLAHIIAAELNAPMVQTAGSAMERKADIAAFLTALEPGSVFFIDEIHRLGRAVEETLYPAMEDRRLPVVLGQGAGARTVTLDREQQATSVVRVLDREVERVRGRAHPLVHHEAVPPQPARQVGEHDGPDRRRWADGIRRGVGDGVGADVGGAADGDAVGDGRLAVGVTETAGLGLAAGAPQAATRARSRSATIGVWRNM